MQICLLLRDCANRFNQAADLVCVEYANAIGSSGVCSPCDRNEFNRLVKNKIAATVSETATATALHTITGDNHVHTKLSA
ncbi:MAG: hypothetical protein IM596_07935 [Pseudanabaena sp. M051S1SP2A07QC]|nr:hypothetical protein [Pseudanabaena sp. M051S1SP2A07QC]